MTLVWFASGRCVSDLKGRKGVQRGSLGTRRCRRPPCKRSSGIVLLRRLDGKSLAGGERPAVNIQPDDDCPNARSVAPRSPISHTRLMRDGKREFLLYPPPDVAIIDGRWTAQRAVHLYSTMTPGASNRLPVAYSLEFFRNYCPFRLMIYSIATPIMKKLPPGEKSPANAATVPWTVNSNPTTFATALASCHRNRRCTWYFSAVVLASNHISSWSSIISSTCM